MIFVKKIQNIIQHIAPTLASALSGPFSGVALKFISTNLLKDDQRNGVDPEAAILASLNDHESLKVVHGLEELFKQEMASLQVDVFSLEKNSDQTTKDSSANNLKPQILISVLFLITYFLMLAAIFTVEVSDSLNMKPGGNSLMGELQILFGVLTAGVGQILSFWFGGLLGKRDSEKNL
jgi:hypothetical protein